MTGTRVMRSTRTRTGWTSSVGGAGRAVTCSAATSVIMPSAAAVSSVTWDGLRSPLLVGAVSLTKLLVITSEAVHKNNSVSGRLAGWLKKVRLETFFFSFLQKKKILQKWTLFSWEKKKSAAARLVSILATRCTGNRIFFMDSLTGLFKMF